MGKGKKRRVLKSRKVKKMTNMTVTKTSLANFIQQNKTKIYETARKNTNYNENGQATISKNDSWFQEDEWDEHFKRITNKK